MKSKLLSTLCCVLAIPLLCSAEVPTQRINIQVDGERPIAGERSRFAAAPNGDLFFTYTLTAGDLSCKPLGVIHASGKIEMTAIDSESTWNVDGWGTYGFPFDLVVDAAGEVHAAARHRGPPYGVDYWRGGRLESFGADVTFGGNNVSLGILPGSKPLVVCLDRNRTQLTVWERSDDGEWSATRPPELSNVASGHFDLVVGDDGSVHVVLCPMKSGPVCATRDPQGNWTREQIAKADSSHMIAAVRDSAGRVHVSYVANLREVNYAVKDDEWRSKTVATVDSDHHAGRTDIAAAAGRVAIAWERGSGRKAKPKDYGGTVGATMLTVIDGDTHELVASNTGRPSVALSADGKTAWVGVYTGNDGGDDFYILNCRLDGGTLAAASVVQGDPASMFRDGCLNDIDSGNEKAERRGLQRIDFATLTTEQRVGLIERYRDHDDPVIRKSIVRGLAKSVDALEHLSTQLLDVLNDPDQLVRKTFLEGLVAGGEQRFAQPVVEKALAMDDAMTRLAAAEAVRLHPDWISPAALKLAVTGMGRDLNSESVTAAGSAAMSLERLIDVEGVRAQLQPLSQLGPPLQRVRASLVLFRAGDKIDVNFLATPGTEQAQLALCGLLGQMRTAACVPLLEQSLESKHPSVRTAAVFALRSIAHVADLKPVAKHPHGFDILALRPAEPSTAEEAKTQEAAIAALTRAVGNEDPNVRQKSIDALNRVGAVLATPLLDDPDPGVRIAARGSLIDHEAWRRASAKRPIHKLGEYQRQPTAIIDGVIQAGSDKQLLIDDFIIAEQSGLTRRLHSFKKHPRNPVFHAQQPWEEGWADPFMSTVIYDRDERCFKMWYRCGPRHSLKAYAVSEDGVHWERPDIAQTKWAEHDHHNLLGFEGQIATWKKPGNNVQFFPEATGADRFLSLFYQPPTKDFAISRSADGVNWQQPQSVRAAHGDVVSLIWNPAQENYLFFPKYKREHDGFVRRSFAATTIEKVDSPFTANFPFLAGHRDDALVADGACRAYGSLLPNTLRLADFHSEIYSVTAIPYESVVVALYDLWPVHGSAEGPLDMPMKISRDMKTWTDVDYPRRALEIGQFGEWDSGMVYGGNTMLVVDDQLLLYYLGANMGHCTRVLPTTKPYHSVGVGLATLRLDGFASLQAGKKPGEFTTKPMRIAGDRLEINGRCQEGGSIRVELLDAEGKPRPGFSIDDCDPFEGDSIRHTVTWNGNPALPNNLSKQVSLRLVIASGDAYSFRFTRSR